MVCCMILSCSKPINSIETQSENKNETNACPDSEHATLKNLTGLDGCSWVLVLDNGKKLEPTNLKKFYNIKLEDGKEVYVKYETKPLAASICMVGTIVEIICISEK
jgi:hypothetical protein